MELTAMRYFAAVARELHFRRAAARLHITEAPLSAAIRKLEEEVGARLFERTSRSVRLTAAGAVFLPEAEAVLRRAEAARHRLAAFVAGQCERLALGYNETALNSFLPQVLAQSRRQTPQIRLELRELETAEQLQLLRDGVLDLGIMRPFGFALDGLASRLVHRESYRLVMPPSHPLARAARLDARALSGQEIILFARDVNPAIFDRLAHDLAPDGAPPPHFRQDARNKLSMLAMVKAGFGAALLPESCCTALDGLVARTLDLPLPDVDLHAVWNQERLTPPLARFLPLLPQEPK